METLTMDATLHRTAGIEWSVASRALPGETVSGDQYVVAATGDGVLLAVIDGLGHGEPATRAATTAAELLARAPAGSVVALVEDCHRALRDSRGAAMTLVSVDCRRRIATGLGVGNVEAVLVRRAREARRGREAVLLRGGVVGYRLPPLQTNEFTVFPGDVLVFATDGVREDFGDGLDADEPVTQLAERLLAQKFRGTDDALVLACRLLVDDET